MSNLCCVGSYCRSYCKLITISFTQINKLEIASSQMSGALKSFTKTKNFWPPFFPKPLAASFVFKKFFMLDPKSI